MSRILAALVISFFVGLTYPQISYGYGGNSFLGKSLTHWTKQLETGNASGRRSAAFALGKIGEGASAQIPLLLKVARSDASWSVRDAAAFAIGEICKVSLGGPTTDDPQLSSKLQAAFRVEQAPLVRRSLVYAIGCLPRRDVTNALPFLDRVVSNQSEHAAVRQNAAWALGQMDASAVNSLRKALRDTDDLVKRDAAIALLNYKKEAAPALRELLACLSSKNSEARKAASTLLVDIVTPKDADVAEGPLVKGLTDRYEEVRWNAALALGNIGGPGAAKAMSIFVKALRSKDINRIKQAAGAINTIGPNGKPAIPALVSLLKHRNNDVQEMAAVALGGIRRAGTSAIPHLVRVVADTGEDIDVRHWAADAVLRIGQDAMKVPEIRREGIPELKNAIRTLTKVIGNPRDKSLARNWALVAMFGHGGHLAKEENLLKTVEQMLKEPKNPSDHPQKKLRYDSAFLLGRIRGPNATKETLDVLTEYLQDKSLKIYRGVKSGTSGSGVERGNGNVKVDSTSSGDARILPLQALKSVGGAVVKNRPEIVRELESIIREKEASDEVKDAARELLKKVNNAK